MTEVRHFVGRHRELTRFHEVLADPIGRAVLIVGPEGIGKSTLANRMLQEATEQKVLACSVLKYEVTPNDSVESTLERALHDAEILLEDESSWAHTANRKEQWLALAEVVAGKRGKALTKLLGVLRNPKNQPARERFVEALEALACHFEEHHRVLILIDPIIHLPDGSAEDWLVVARELPDRFLLLFAQRPDDALATSRKFKALSNLVRIPDDHLSVLDDAAVGEYLRFCGLGHLRERFQERFAGHPYAVTAAVDLILDEGLPPEVLPEDPSDVAKAQWEHLAGSIRKRFRSSLPIRFSRWRCRTNWYGRSPGWMWCWRRSSRRGRS